MWTCRNLIETKFMNCKSLHMELGSFPLQRWRICTAHPAGQLQSKPPTRVGGLFWSWDLAQAVRAHQFGACRALSRSKVDGFEPQSWFVNFRTVRQPGWGRALTWYCFRFFSGYLGSPIWCARAVSCFEGAKQEIRRFEAGSSLSCFEGTNRSRRIRLLLFEAGSFLLRSRRIRTFEAGKRHTSFWRIRTADLVCQLEDSYPNPSEAETNIIPSSPLFITLKPGAEWSARLCGS